MSTIQLFEDLEIWQLAREISNDVYRITRNEHFKKDFSLVDQIRRSSGSAMDNIAEGFEKDGNKEFRQYLSIAKGSAGETRSQLYRSIDQNYINKEEFDYIHEKLLKLSKKIKNFMKYLTSSKFKGQKYKPET